MSQAAGHTPQDQQKAFIEVEHQPRIDFIFNPTEVAFTMRASWNDEGPTAGRKARVTFKGQGAGSMSLSILLDATLPRTSPIRERVAALMGTVSVPAEGASLDRAGKRRPPSVQFTWGGLFVPFRCVVEQLQVRYTLFAVDGTPLRARCDLTLKEFTDSPAPSEPATGQPGSSPASVTAAPSQTLADVAATAYGQPEAWRPIADANGVTDPMKPPIGLPLAVPALPPVRPRG